MAGSNRRLLLDSLHVFRFEETPIPQVPDGGAVVKISHSGICFSDVHMAHTPKFHPTFEFPRVLGHEISGTVYQLSKKAQEARPDLSVGDRVMVFPWGNCQNCNFCRANCSFCSTSAYGRGPNNGYVYGVWRDGGYQQYMVVDISSFLEKVPENVSMAAAALMPCSGLTSYNAVCTMRESIDRAKRVNGCAQVGVIGAGGLALWAIQIIKALYSPNVTVVAVDISEEKLEDAKANGADIVHKWSKDEPAADAVKKLVETCGGARMDAVVDFIGEPSLERSFLSLNLGGTLVMVGLSGSMMPAMTLNSVLRRNVIIRGSIVGSLVQLREFTELVRDGKVTAPPIEEITLDDVEKTMQKLLDGKQRGRAVIKM